MLLFLGNHLCMRDQFLIAITGSFVCAIISPVLDPVCRTHFHLYSFGICRHAISCSLLVPSPIITSAILLFQAKWVQLLITWSLALSYPQYVACVLLVINMLLTQIPVYLEKNPYSTAEFEHQSIHYNTYFPGTPT